VVLHGNEGRELACDGIVCALYQSAAVAKKRSRRRTLHSVELVGMARTHSDISHIARLNDIMKSLHL